ncbi:MAG TPA: hypothetical protein DCZ95_11410 [Verrucomicrobia bacterium]|nr:MAG: hypothetical protein A2X46_04190 [Lentisphaerae bacterium GWF2_57_35]HBA84691.1 hypothetical protein [Verrucomicrobiota bacterium]
MNAPVPARWVFVLFAALLGLSTAERGLAGAPCVEIRNGYFWDSQAGAYWIPHGFAYQTINPYVFATQTPEQIDYDFLEMKKLHADSLRVDFTWGYIEPAAGSFDWTGADRIVATAEKYGLRLFPLIGYQYPPDWATNYSWMAVNQSNRTSNVLNYNHPGAIAAYTNFIGRLTARYKDSPAIAGWILGNEYAYFDLWEPYDPHLFLGYDANYSLPSFRGYLTNLYSGNIAALNANWGTAYAAFDTVVMPLAYPGIANPGDPNLQNRNSPPYHDLIQWRKKSIGDFVAAGSLAARNADTNHLRSYSMVGGIYSGFDANNTCEDAKTIVARCAAAGAPLDFWSINNYAWASEGNELRTAQFGITKYQDQSGLPVLVTETGHSSTENLFPGASPRQAAALPGQVWEALIAGAAGVHIFTWNDRPFGGSQIREAGFGIVQLSRLIKNPVYWNIQETFRRMEQSNLPSLLGASRSPSPDIYLYWSSDADMVWPRANQENGMLWGGLKRLGYEPRFLDEDGLDAGAYTNAQALLLSHAFSMSAARLAQLTNALAAGIHLHANAALPGRYDPYHKENPGWAALMADVFGLNVGAATNSWHGGIAGNWEQPYTGLYFEYLGALGPLTPSYPWTNISTWIRMMNITAHSGVTVVKGKYDYWGMRELPALQTKDHPGQGKAAINTFALGDSVQMWWLSPRAEEMVWQLHSDWGRAIYRDGFGMQPAIDLVGTGRFYVVPDYRLCTNGSILISLLNESTNAVSIALNATNLIRGKTVEQLSSAKGIVASNSTGQLNLTLAGDEYLLLYAYTNNESLANTSPYKIWLASEPPGIWPNGQGVSVQVGYDTRGETMNLHLDFRTVGEAPTIYGQTNCPGIAGTGTNELRLNVAEADLGNPAYLSTPEGGAYELHAWLEKSGEKVSECTLPARLLWGARPASIPASVQTGQTYQIVVHWQELPSFLPDEYPTPLSRADVWPSSNNDATEKYCVTLDLLNSNGVSIVSTTIVTSTGTSSNRFFATTPAALPQPPYSWKAAAISDLWGDHHDVLDGFEDREQGNGEEFISPWTAFAYDQNGGIQVWSRGVDGQASEGIQSAFMDVNNPNPGGWSGFGMTREYSQAWALPPPSQRSNIWFAFDFKETNVVNGTLTMKVEDSGAPSAGALEFTAAYTGGWQTISNRLSNFTVSAYPGTFNSNSIKKLTVLLQTGAQVGLYQSHFDNIRFVGTTGEWMGATSSGNLHSSFEDLTRGEWVAPAPWSAPQSYPDGGSQQWITHGIDATASDGINGHFFIFTSHTNDGGYSGIYELYTFPQAPSLPSDLSKAGFSLDFSEANGDACDVELQIKSASGQSTYSRSYSHTPGGWDRFSASLDQFSGDADTAQLTALGVVVKMNAARTEYACHLDNIRFTGVVSTALSPVTNGLYLSINDTPADTDSDHDGIPDLYETDTGIWNGPTDTGTDPHNPDSDGDSLKDGDEGIAGTDPNVTSSFFSADEVRQSASGIVIAWFAHSNRIYSVHYFDGNLMSGGPFAPLGSFTNILAASDGATNVVDAASQGVTQRFYRVNVRRP